jgi:hypothetical protein
MCNGHVTAGSVDAHIDTLEVFGFNTEPETTSGRSEANAPAVTPALELRRGRGPSSATAD